VRVPNLKVPQALDPLHGGGIRRRTVVLLLAAFALIVVGGIGLGVVTSGYQKTNGGEVGVVRNGGPLDNNRIRQVIEPASSLTWTGAFSTTHPYPAQQRFYTITADQTRGDRTGVDVVRIPTSDGVDVGIEGTIYFTLTLDHASLRTFDDKFGTCSFRGSDGTNRHAYDGDDGWSTFTDQPSSTGGDHRQGAASTCSGHQATRGPDGQRCKTPRTSSSRTGGHHGGQRQGTHAAQTVAEEEEHWADLPRRPAPTPRRPVAPGAFQSRPRDAGRHPGPTLTCTRDFSTARAALRSPASTAHGRVVAAPGQHRESQRCAAGAPTGRSRSPGPSTLVHLAASTTRAARGQRPRRGKRESTSSGATPTSPDTATSTYLDDALRGLVTVTGNCAPQMHQAGRHAR